MPRSRSRKTAPLGDKDWERAFEALNNEVTERGLVIVADAFLDTIVESILRVRFAGDEKFHNQLLDPNQPLGSAASRRKIARAIGIIGGDMYEAMSILGGMRNSFAHLMENHDSINDQLARLCELTHVATSESQDRKALLLRIYLVLIGRLGVIALETERIKDGPRLPKPTIVRA